MSLLGAAALAAGAESLSAQSGIVTCGQVLNGEWITNWPTAVSRDGSVIVGSSGYPFTCSQNIQEMDPFLWTAAAGSRRLIEIAMVDGCNVLPTDITDDGQFVVGWSKGSYCCANHAFRWSQSIGYQVLWSSWPELSGAYAVTSDGRTVVGQLAGRTCISRDLAPPQMLVPQLASESLASDVSGDGRVVVGFAFNESLGTPDAFRWTRETGLAFLGIGQSSVAQSHAMPRVSADGSTIIANVGPLDHLVPIRWTPSGANEIGLLPGFEYGAALGVSSDGSMIFGTCFSPGTLGTAFIWTEHRGTVALATYLAERGVNVRPGTELYDARAISSDGNVIVGWGRVRGFAGAAFRAQIHPCYADCDGDSIAPNLNVSDFICFLSRFAAALTLSTSQQVGNYANCDGTTSAPVLTAQDFTCFAAKFAAGCP